MNNDALCEADHTLCEQQTGFEGLNLRCFDPVQLVDGSPLCICYI
jgi:hypothetical protein